MISLSFIAITQNKEKVLVQDEPICLFSAFEIFFFTFDIEAKIVIEPELMFFLCYTGPIFEVDQMAEFR